MQEFNEVDFARINSNAGARKLTIEFTAFFKCKGSSYGFKLISIPKSDFNDFYIAINVLKGRMICVAEEWKYNEFTTNDWERIYQHSVKGGIIEELDLISFKNQFSQLINYIKSPLEEDHIAKPISKQILGGREYNPADTRDQFNTKYEISDENIENFNPLDSENILTAYGFKGDDFYFDDLNNYYGLFYHI